MYMIRVIGYEGNPNQPYRWHSVSTLESSLHPENHLKECRMLMRLITLAIDSYCRKNPNQKEALDEIRSLFTMYITLSSYARQTEMEQIRIQMDEKSRSVSPAFICVPQYEDELISSK